MKHLLISCFLCFSCSAFAQDHTSIYFDSVYRFHLYKMVENAAEGSTVIGLGEATHGTKEFGMIKADIVKQLVLKHGFSTFILEDGYMNCLQINDYIHGKDLDSTAIFRNIAWPWATKELLALIHWMRAYNEQQCAAKQITFYGADICVFPRSEYIQTQVLPLNNKELVNELWRIYFDSTRTQKDKLSLLKAKEKELKSFSSAADSLLVWNHFTSAYCYTLEGGKRKKYREEKLAAMVRGIMDVSPQHAKHIIWAHNQHVSKKSTHRKSMGYFLAASPGTKYTSAGFDFYQGSFRAINLDKPVNTNRMDVFEVDSLSESSVNYIPAAKKQVAFVSLKNEDNVFPQKFLIRDIGAVYSTHTLQKRKLFFTTRISRNRSFDYLIVIPRSTPSTHYTVK